jgi:leucine dehydrogenase
LEALDHEEIVVRRGRRSGLYVIAAVHSTRRGPSLGGCRMWTYDDPRAAIADALRLSHAMTLKAAVADVPLGGGKGVIMLPLGPPPSRPRRRAALADFGDLVETLEGRYITAEDVGTSSRDMSAIAERTEHVAGLSRSRGGSGDPSPLTALGVEAAIRAACETTFGTASLRERSVCVLGLGNVGSRVAKRCARAGARLVIADVDDRKRALAGQLGATWVTPAQAVAVEVDVLAPCALGGLLDDDAVGRLRCAVIAGAANNQLADDRVAERLAARGVLWVPDFVANAGGLINIAEEIGGYDAATARRRVQAIGDTLREILHVARSARTTPLAAALEVARGRLASDGGPGPAPRA